MACRRRSRLSLDCQASGSGSRSRRSGSLRQAGRPTLRSARSRRTARCKTHRGSPPVRRRTKHAPAPGWCAGSAPPLRWRALPVPAEVAGSGDTDGIAGVVYADLGRRLGDRCVAHFMDPFSGSALSESVFKSACTFAEHPPRRGFRPDAAPIDVFRPPVGDPLGLWVSESRCLNPGWQK